MEGNNTQGIRYFFTRVKRRLRREWRSYVLAPRAVKRFIRWGNRVFITKEELGACGEHTIVETPVYIEYPQTVFMADHSRIRNYCTIVNTPNDKVVIKKFSVVAAATIIITHNHCSTVGIPHFFLGGSHINDKRGDVVIEEDVWIGANAMIMTGVTVGRGAIVGAGSLVTKDVPPYGLVVGRPAKIIAKKFELEDVLRHEEVLYPPEERLTREYLTTLFETTYKDLKVYGVNTPLTQEQKAQLYKMNRRYKEPIKSDYYNSDASLL